MKTKELRLGIAAAAALSAVALLTAPPATAQSEGQGQGQAVITILPARDGEAPATITQQDLAVKIDGKDATVTNFMPYRGQNDRLEVVIMVDSGARTSMATQIGEIAGFINGLPPSARVALAYMEHGAARFTGQLTTNHQEAAGGLHIPSGLPGEDASPYLCLSDLARHWPSTERNARRIVVMITDGVDYYDPRFDPQDPYMQASIADSVRSGLVVYSIYWKNKGRFDNTEAASFSGQNLLQMVTQATGGNSYWIGTGDPVSFQPYFKDLDRRLENQYELAFTAPLKNKSQAQSMKVKVNGISGKVDAPQQVWVGHPAM
ncbi:MAG TPA: hypothetical protein VKB38_14135 [Terracidiphilus sp.]|nr:hypothetical protein [Terracidiphilus sp.]